MKVHILSDVHPEFGKWSKAVDVRAIDADVTILAGDIGVGLQGAAWALEAFDRPVIYVLGNHEFYGQRSMAELVEKMRKKCAGTDVHFLQNEAVVIGGLRFLGATLWTDFEVHGQGDVRAKMARMEATVRMSDYRHIFIRRHAAVAWEADGGVIVGGDSRHSVWFSVERSIALHRESRAWLAAQLATPRDGPTVVVTHHAPSAKSLTYQEATWLLDAAYASNQEDLMGGDRVALWLHGHTHLRTDYEIRGTRVLSNPRGYIGDDLVEGFEPGLVVEV